MSAVLVIALASIPFLAFAVVSRQAVLDLAQQWEDEAPAYDADLARRGRQVPWPVREQRRRYHILAGADELRALTTPDDTHQETP